MDGISFTVHPLGSWELSDPPPTAPMDILGTRMPSGGGTGGLPDWWGMVRRGRNVWWAAAAAARLNSQVSALVLAMAAMLGVMAANTEAR